MTKITRHCAKERAVGEVEDKMISTERSGARCDLCRRTQSGDISERLPRSTWVVGGLAYSDGKHDFSPNLRVHESKAISLAC